METIKKYILQRRDAPGSGEWTDAGVAVEKLEWAKLTLKNFSDSWPEREFRIVERTVITIYKLVNL